MAALDFSATGDSENQALKNRPQKRSTKIEDLKIKLKILKKYHKLKVYGEELKTPDGRQAKKYRKEHSVELSEYREIRKQVLEFYPSGHIPKVENLEKRISSLESDLSAKNAEFRGS